MKPHYFNQIEADSDDFQLEMAKMQRYVPETCLLNGITVMTMVEKCVSPCEGCVGPRDICKGRI